MENPAREKVDSEVGQAILRSLPRLETTMNGAVFRLWTVIAPTPLENESLYQDLSNYLSNIHLPELDHLRLDKAISILQRSIPYLQPTRSLYHFWRDLGQLYTTRFKNQGEIPDIELAIDCLNRSITLSPDTSEGKTGRHTSLGFLGDAYLRRFEHLGVISDINMAVDYDRQCISLVPDNNPNRSRYLSNLGTACQFRFARLGDLSDIDEAINYHNQAVSATPDGHKDQSRRLYNLGGSHSLRFERLGDLADIDKAIGYESQAALLTPEGHSDRSNRLHSLGNSYSRKFRTTGNLGDLARAIDYLKEAAIITPDEHVNKPPLLSHLGNAYALRFEHSNNEDDINNAILVHTQATTLAPRTHIGQLFWLQNLAGSYVRRAKYLKQAVDLDRAIEIQKDLLGMIPEGYVFNAQFLLILGGSYETRHSFTHDLADLGRANDFYRESALSSVGHPRTLLSAAHRWANKSSICDESSTLQAYRRLFEILPRVVWLGVDIAHRYKDISSLDTSFGDIVTQAASAAIRLQEYDQALEWLEEGRSIVWNQILQLRTPLDSLRLVDAELADELQRVSRELETASVDEPGDFDTFRTAWSAEQAAQHHRQLARRCDQLLQKARDIPGFQSFLRPKKVSELVSGAKDSVVIAINVHHSRCDALALIPGNSAVAHIPLPSFSTQKAIEAHYDLANLLGYANNRARSLARQPVFQDMPEESQFEPVLETLWVDVVRPILDHLGYLEHPPVDRLPRITWCATGPLAFLPLHAAGYYNDPQARVSDFVVSSYTPTISALLKQAPSPGDFRGILSVGQAAAAGASPLPGTIAELDQIQKLATHISHTRLEGRNATAGAVLKGMEQNSWVHLACHASQNTGDPTASALLLHGSNLDLATITRKSLKNVGLAFLSACETATGDEKLPEEAVHLAAGMIMAGYSSVIGTMWSIRDQDAPLVAKEVYARLLDGIPDARGAARALHTAVGRLRDGVGDKEFARWVPYIHIGI